MAFARDVYTAASSQTDFTITFTYFDSGDILVYDAGTLKTLTTDYTLPNATTVRFNSSVTDGNTVVIQRSSSQNTRLVDYTAGALSEADLDNDSLQAFQMSQEAIDIANLALPKGTTELWDAGGTIIDNVGTPTVDDHAATKKYADDLAQVAGNVVAPADSGEDNYLLKASGGAWSWAAATSFFWTVADDTTAAAARTTLGAGVLDNLVEDTTPQLGGDLDLNGNNLDFPTTPNISDCIDDDTMAAASAVKLATSESIKAYVDSVHHFEFVSTAAITAATTLVVTGLTAGYDYQINLEAFAPTDDGQIPWMRLSDDAGVSYEADSGDYDWGVSDLTGGTRGTNDTEIQLTGSNTVGNDATQFALMRIEMINPNSSSENATILWEGFHHNVDATPLIIPDAGTALFAQGADAVDAVQFLWSGGSTFKAQGDITVWRRKRS